MSDEAINRHKMMVDGRRGPRTGREIQVKGRTVYEMNNGLWEEEFGNIWFIKNPASPLGKRDQPDTWPRYLNYDHPSTWIAVRPVLTAEASNISGSNGEDWHF